MSVVERLTKAGMSPAVAEHKALMLERCRAGLEAAGAGLADVRMYVVPGRIEVLGKHTDYAGGRSLLAAVERAIVMVAVPRADTLVRVTRLKTDETVEFALGAIGTFPPNHWSLFPATVARRLGDDFRDLKGVDIAFASDLPMAAGLSSSSAFITGLAMAVMTRNALAEREDFLAEVKTREDLCGYMGAVESGYGFGSFLGGGGVGTAGGSEDHTAILSARAGKLLRCSFLPVKIERELPLPAGYVFVVGVSGIVADKTGNALERYNRASRIAKTMLDRWKQTTGRKDVSLAAALGSSRGAPDQLADMLKREWDAAPFINRLRQFREESDDIIPGVSAALERKDVSALGPLVDRSQALAEEVLENQTPETIALQRSARDLGAAAASAFGAGFGGSVWALIEAKRAEEFVPRWRESYLKKFPALQNRAEVFVTQAGPGLISLS